MAESTERFYGRTDHAAITVQPGRGQYVRPSLPEAIVAMAEAEYERQGYGQTSAVLRKWGGLSIDEVVSLLGDAMLRWAPPEALIPPSREADHG